jgi:ribonuclease HI
MSSQIQIYTDGACSGNPGPGGWGAVIIEAEMIVEIGGHETHTTNNRMELLAAIEALKAVASSKSLVQLFSDSKYILGGAQSWMSSWKKKGWRTAQGSAVLNRDLWEKLDQLIEARGKGLTWHYIPGHSGLFGNTRADEIAVAFSKREPADLYEGPTRRLQQR